MDWSRYPNFSEGEMRCHCGCGRAEMDPGFMAWLQLVRNDCGFALPVSSGFRCPDHNRTVSTTGRDGPHTTGKAVDIRIHGARALRLVEKALARGVQGLGVLQHGASRFIHLDLLEAPAAPRPTIWTY